MIGENITAAFVCAHVFLNCMNKQKKGMYISICSAVGPQEKAVLVLEDIAANTQVQMAKLFAAEVKGYGFQYHHLFVGQPPVENKNYLLNSPDTGDSVVRLFIANNVDL